MPARRLPPHRRRLPAAPLALTPPAGLLSSMGRLFLGKPALPIEKRLWNIQNRRRLLPRQRRLPRLPLSLSPARQEWGPAAFLSGLPIRHGPAGTAPQALRLRKNRRLPARYGRNRTGLPRRPRPRCVAGLPARTPARQEHRPPGVRQGSQPVRRPGGRRLSPPQQTH